MTTERWPKARMSGAWSCEWSGCESAVSEKTKAMSEANDE